MLGTHVHLVVYGEDDLLKVDVSVDEDRYATWQGVQPYFGGLCDTPMQSDLQWVRYFDLDKAGVISMTAAKCPDFMNCQVHCNYGSPEDHTLDLYCQKGINGGWHLWLLQLPSTPPSTSMFESYTEDYPYPQPPDWIHALSRRYVRPVSATEWAAMSSSDDDQNGDASMTGDLGVN